LTFPTFISFWNEWMKKKKKKKKTTLPQASVPTTGAHRRGRVVPLTGAKAPTLGLELFDVRRRENCLLFLF
jgi:hypothetical protein